MMRRGWVAQCDHPGCRGAFIAEPGELERWEFGITLVESGWNAAPNRPETLCPQHAPAQDPE